MPDVSPAVTLHFAGSSWRFRLAAFFRGLRRPRSYVPLLLVAALPAAVERAVSIAAPADGMFLAFVALGACGALLLIALGALRALVLRARPSSITFAATGIREEVGDRVLEHPWSWIVDVTEGERALTLHCAEPMRSFQLASSARTRQLIVDRATGGIGDLQRLLEVHLEGSRIERR